MIVVFNSMKVDIQDWLPTVQRSYASPNDARPIMIPQDGDGQK